MKKYILLIIVFLFVGELFAQFNLPSIIKRKVEEKAEQKTEEAVERALEGEQEEAEEEKAEGKNEEGTKNDASNTKLPSNSIFKSFSKYDFIPGKDVLFYEDFSKDLIGEFPARWNTNGSGEVVTTDLYPGNWLKLTSSSIYLPELKINFPENFTIEFDVIGSKESDYKVIGHLRFDIFSANDMKEAVKDGYVLSYNNKASVVTWLELSFESAAYYSVNNYLNGEEGNIKNSKNDVILNNLEGKLIKVAVAVNKYRYRLWINGKKIYDVPRMMGDEKYNLFRIMLENVDETVNYQVLLSNIRIAAGLQDARSGLLTDGKFSTNSITFNSGSDKLRPESFPVIKSIADVLTASPEVKIKIVGHTDSDGNAEKNLMLSKNRAMAVKNSLVTDFGIDAARIESYGMGASVPVSDNTTAEGKAKNRRVEFIKQ